MTSEWIKCTEEETDNLLHFFENTTYNHRYDVVDIKYNHCGLINNATRGLLVCNWPPYGCINHIFWHCTRNLHGEYNCKQHINSNTYIAEIRRHEQ